jgi:hypothetical protein
MDSEHCLLLAMARHGRVSGQSRILGYLALAFINFKLRHYRRMVQGAWYRALGKIEGISGYARRNFKAPVQVFEISAARNRHLADCSVASGRVKRLRGRTETNGERLERDLAALRQPLRTWL